MKVTPISESMVSIGENVPSEFPYSEPESKKPSKNQNKGENLIVIQRDKLHAMNLYLESILCFKKSVNFFI